MAFSHLLELENVHTELSLAEGTLRAVDGVSLTIDAGETLGIVGESGSGKSMTALSIMRLLPRSGRIVEGSIRFKDRVLSDLSEDEMEAIRGTEMAMIFQDPMTSLNPVYRTGWQVGEPLRIHRHVGSGEAIATATDLFRQVGIPDAKSRVRHFPHMLSGGMRQRAMIAMGLSTSRSRRSKARRPTWSICRPAASSSRDARSRWRAAAERSHLCSRSATSSRGVG